MPKVVTLGEDCNRGQPTITLSDEGWAVLNEYWKTTDDQTAIVISMILDPRCRLTGLPELGWTVPQIRTEAILLFEELYITRGIRRCLRFQRHLEPLLLPDRTMQNILYARSLLKPDTYEQNLFSGWRNGKRHGKLMVLNDGGSSVVTAIL